MEPARPLMLTQRAGSRRAASLAATVDACRLRLREALARHQPPAVAS